MKEKLYRSRRVRVFGGVAGGLAQYFNIDPIIVRVLFVVITIMNGIGILLYIILWIVVPEEPFETAYKVKTESSDSAQTEDAQKEANISHHKISGDRGRVVAGFILIIIGLFFLADRFIPAFNFHDVFPILLVLLGAYLIWNSIKK